MNQIIYTNRAVRVKFNAYTSNTQTTQSSNASIYVPFPVREILIKGIDLDFGSDFKTMFFTSSLVDGNYVGFEPQIELYKIFTTNLTLNNCSNARSLNFALGEYDGVIELPAVDYRTCLKSIPLLIA